MIRYLLNAQVIESDVVIVICLCLRILKGILLQEKVDTSILALNHS